MESIFAPNRYRKPAETTEIVTISGQAVEWKGRRLWGKLRRADCDPGFLNKLDKRRAKNRMARKSRQASR